VTAGPDGAPGALVIGAGPAGLMAAECLAQAGHRVLVAEAKPSPARKFLMAGKSGLNLTKAEDARRFEAAFRALSLVARPDLSEAVRINKDLHFAIYDAMGLPTLAEIIGGLWLKAGPVLNLDLGANPERLAAGGAVRFHAEALAAIRAGDGPAARAAIAADIRGAADFIIARGGLAAP